ncbi:cubilin isoform X1 [Ciona intestinalis]
MKQFIFSAFILLLLTGIKDASACSMLGLTGGAGYTSPFLSASTYPSNNPHNLNCYYRINAQSSSNVIKVNFRNVNVEVGSCCNTDYFAVYEGSSSTSRLIGKYCGQHSSIILQGRGQYMYIHYHTDSSVYSTGFEFQFIVSASATPSCDQLSIGGGPGTGFITSPNYSANYPHQADCRYRIDAGSATRTITLTFTAFDLESHPDCRFDFVEVRTEMNAHCAPNVRKYCGSTVPTTQVITGQQYAYIQFFSDSSVTRPGFRMEWTVSADPCSMLGLAGSVGHVSPYYSASTHPANNPHNTDCYYQINGESTFNVIKVDFTSFSLEANANCAYDYVAVYEGPSVTSRLIAKYCGTKNSFSVSGRGQYMYMHYHTDNSVHSTGFQFRFSVSASATPSCDQLSIGGAPGSGVITSPNYPLNYPHHSDCRYRICSDSNSTITLDFAAFNLESHNDCNYDFVDVRSGSDGDWTPNALKVCGTALPATLTFNQQCVYIQFFSDSSASRTGFSLRWTIAGVVPGPPGCTQLNLGGAPGSDGLIKSPNYPSNYPINLDCRYQVYSDCSSNNIAFVFLAFDVESHTQCKYDYVELFRGCSTTSGSQGKFCGTTVPGPSTSYRTSCKSMRFKTDGSVARSGFNMRYTVTGTCCPSSGVISSPSYPLNYHNNADNCYVICPPGARRIRLRFNMFIMEGSEPSCRYDSLTIKRTYCTSGSQLDKFCGTKTTPFTRTYTASKLALKFKTDGSVVKKGFSLYFSKVL